MIAAAEFFLVRLFSDVEDVKIFDDLRYSVYHKNSANLDLEKLPCTSNAIEQHIRNAYFQCRRWINSAQACFTDEFSEEYGYNIDETDGVIVTQ